MIKQAEVNIHMPYVPEISVNKAYRKGSPRYGKLPEVEYWLYRLKATMMEESQKFGPPVSVPILDLYLFAPRQKGRIPDTSNFRKLPQDVISVVLGVEDSRFGGTDFPAQRSHNPGLYLRVRWDYDDQQPWSNRDSSKRVSHNPDSILYFGPQPPPIEGACVGYGSVYCMTCSENPESWCPVQFDPSLFSDNPCKECVARDACPCMTNPKEREEQIKLWWRGRVRSVKFERENWE